jgi:hypothetical protein
MKKTPPTGRLFIQANADLVELRRSAREQLTPIAKGLREAARQLPLEDPKCRQWTDVQCDLDELVRILDKEPDADATGWSLEVAVRASALQALQADAEVPNLAQSGQGGEILRRLAPKSIHDLFDLIGVRVAPSDAEKKWKAESQHFKKECAALQKANAAAASECKEKIEAATAALAKARRSNARIALLALLLAALIVVILWRGVTWQSMSELM